LRIFLWTLAFLSFAHASFAQTAKKKSLKASPPPPPAAPAPEAPAPVESAPPAAARSPMSGEDLNFAEGRYGFSVGFPDGGSTFGAGFVGLRYFTSDHSSLGGYLLLSNDSSAETSAFGLGGKFTNYIAHRDRVHLYWFGQLLLGKNGGKANKGKDDTLFGLGGGGGLEYSLLKDFSVSAEGGLGFNTLPDGKSAYATGTGKIAINFYY
jgi:hypothetical protein